MHLRENSFVFVISELPPLVEAIELEFESVAAGSLLEEVVLGPFVLHRLVAGHRVILLLRRHTTLTGFVIEIHFCHRLRVRLVLGGLRTSFLLGTYGAESFCLNSLVTAVVV